MSETPADDPYLRTPDAVRERAHRVLGLGLDDSLSHFAIDLERLPEAARRVVEVTRETYPSLDIPYHGRLRHFEAGGVDRLHGFTDPAELIDLVVTSVLLDAGAGTTWRYREPGTDVELSRSEGLAVASLHMFRTGLVAGDAEALKNVTLEAVREGFQASTDNPLVGLEGRCHLLASLGRALDAHPEMFGRPGRVGHLLEYFRGIGASGRVEARRVLDAILVGLQGIWPGDGDVFFHRSVGSIPFHKLSQWLTYSLIEPLERGGLEVVGLDALTGLAEYRNGGLFVDTAVLRPRHDAVLDEWHEPGSEVVVEWRALTVALIDRVAEPVRRELGMDADALPLAKILEGGTWRAGRVIAAELRDDGGPPIHVRSSGNLF